MPVQFTDRWGGHREGLSYEDCVCWHLLLGADAGVRSAVGDVQRRLSRFRGMHMTPIRWLHATVLQVGPAAEITDSDAKNMLTTVAAALADAPAVAASLGRVLYGAEGIALELSPAAALSPVLDAAREATLKATGMTGSVDHIESAWKPHMTVCYSTVEQPAAPVIAELGKAIPACEITIDRLSLVIQNGPEQLWDWQVIGSAPLGVSAHPRAAPDVGRLRSRVRPARPGPHRGPDQPHPAAGDRARRR